MKNTRKKGPREEKGGWCQRLWLESHIAASDQDCRDICLLGYAEGM